MEFYIVINRCVCELMVIFLWKLGNDIGVIMNILVDSGCGFKLVFDFFRLLVVMFARLFMFI